MGPAGGGAYGAPPPVGGDYGAPQAPQAGGYGPPPGGGYGPPPGGGGDYGAPPGGGYGPPPGGYGGGPPPGGYDPPGGYPPGGYPPMAPMPPSPPKKGGMSGAMIALIVLVGLVVLAFGGCGICLCIGAAATRHNKAPIVTTAEPAKPVKAAPTAPPDNWITADRPFVKFLAPAGWTTQITPDKDWGIFKSPKRDAVFAFTTFNRPGESTVRLGKAASVLGVTDINWNAPRYSAVGKDKFDAHVADGSCNFEGPGGYIWYATVNTGSSDQILLIFTVSSTAPKARRVEAQAALDTLQRRP